ncbi:hypothetical protein BH11PSE11_BH11PSE11_26330 [soil metagenome]
MTTSVEVKLGVNIYTFNSEADAEAFKTCLKNRPLFTCKEEHPPVSIRTVEEDLSWKYQWN